MMFSRKKSKTISRLEQAQSRVIELKLLAYKWDDYNFTSHESYQEPGRPEQHGWLIKSERSTATSFPETSALHPYIPATDAGFENSVQ